MNEPIAVEHTTPDTKCKVIDSLTIDENDIREKLNEIKNYFDDINKEHRGGKYNKKHAPLPPLCNNSETNLEESSTIKATLILKPGLIKSIGFQSEDANTTEVFVQSPKLKRKVISPQSTRRKTDNAFNKLLMFSKRMGVRLKELDVDNINKRKSWHDVFRNGTTNGLTRQQSKSDDNLSINIRKDI